METRKEKNKTHMAWQGLIWATVLGGFLLSPSITSHALAEPPGENDCISYAYTESNQHLFLLATNKSAFGNNLTIEHNCDYVEVYIDGNFSVYTEDNSFKIPIGMGLKTIEIRSQNHSNLMSNVNIMPDRLSWQFEWQEWQNENPVSFEEFVELSKATAQANWASLLSIVTVFALVTMVYWHLINGYVDRNYCEEVKG